MDINEINYLNIYSHNELTIFTLPTISFFFKNLNI
jgi:hypothetical protein